MAEANPPSASQDRVQVFDAAERLIYNNMHYLIAELNTTPELIEDLGRKEIFPKNQMRNLRACISKGSSRKEVNELLIDLASQLDEPKHVYVFLQSIGKYQEEITELLFEGEQRKDMKIVKRSPGQDTPTDVDGSRRRSARGKLDEKLRMYGKPKEPFRDVKRRRQLLRAAATPSGVIREHIITEKGGEFEFYGGTIRLSVSERAVGPLGATCSLRMSSSRGTAEKVQSDRKSVCVYVSQAFSFFLKHGEDEVKFNSAVTISVTSVTDVPGFKISGDEKCFVFRRDTTEGKLGLGDFQDITDECNPQLIAKSTVQFSVAHFSEYVFMLVSSVLAAGFVGLGLGYIASILGPPIATRQVCLEVLAKQGLEPDVNEIPIKLRTVDAGEDRANAEVGHESIILRSENPEFSLAFYQSVKVEVTSASPCREGYHWSISPDTKVSRNNKPRQRTLQLKQDQAAADNMPARDMHCGREVTVEGRFKCTILHYASRSSTTVHVPFRVLAKEEEAKAHATQVSHEQEKRPDQNEDRAGGGDVEGAGGGADMLTRTYVPCEFDHSVKAQEEEMRDNRKKALQRALDELVRVPHGVDAICDGLVSGCKVLTMKEYEEIRHSQNPEEIMRQLILRVRTKHDSAFDCFVHAVQHRNNKYIADNLRKYAGESL